jgi:tryptophan synthase alpha chain
MGRIAERFALLRARGERALVPFLSAGDPDLETSEALILAMVEAGADLIEIGVPFSDPIAEGPTIQRASERALAGGATLRRILALVKGLRERVEIPLLLMGYANPLYAMGEEAFAAAASEVGVDGIIVPDLPPEEGAGLFAECREKGIDPVLLAAPTTTPERLAMLARETRGFLYYVSLLGVTGARSELAQGIDTAVRAARQASDAPVCVGFGISTPEHAAEVGAYADGVVVGSAIVDLVEKSESRSEAIDRVSRFVSESRSEAIDRVSRFVAELKKPLR